MIEARKFELQRDFGSVAASGNPSDSWQNGLGGEFVALERYVSIRLNAAFGGGAAGSPAAEVSSPTNSENTMPQRSHFAIRIDQGANLGSNTYINCDTIPGRAGQYRDDVVLRVPPGGTLNSSVLAHASLPAACQVSLILRGVIVPVGTPLDQIIILA